MFSQIDQKQIPLKKVMKSRHLVDSLDLLDANLGDGAEAESGGDSKGVGADEATAPVQSNPNMNSIVEELEKRFPSQSTIL